MNKTIRTLGVSMALLTACFSANTVFADSSNDLNLTCNLSETGPASIRWKLQDKDQVSSYKVYVSDPLSQADVYASDLAYKYQEDSSKLYPANTEYAFNNLEKGKFYSFKLEAYKDDKLVKSESLISLIPDGNYAKGYSEEDVFEVYAAAKGSVNIKWNISFADNVKRTIKFYSVDDKGLKEIASADLSAGSCSVKDLEAGKKYFIAAEVLAGDKTEFSSQFSFTADFTEAQTVSADSAKELLLTLNGNDAEVKEETDIKIDKKTKTRMSSIEHIDKNKADYKIFVSEPLSSNDFFARGKAEYKQYLLLDNYVSCDKETGFDQLKIYKNINAGKDYGYTADDVSAFTIKSLKPDMYYSIKADGYSRGKLIASGSTNSYTAEGSYNYLFWDTDMEYHGENITAKSKDGKTVTLTWGDLADKYDLPKGDRTVYFYLSDAVKDRNTVYGPEAPKLSAKYAGKTDYGKKKFKLKDLTAGRHYVLYLETRLDGKIEDLYTYRLSTAVNKPAIQLQENKDNSVKIGSYLSFTRYNNTLGIEFFDNTCITPEGIEYYRKDKNGKFRKIATVKGKKAYTDKNVVLGKTYTYKTRAYATINGKKVYSDFSPETDNTIKVVNYKPVLKIRFVDRKKKIVKITSDKNNAVVSCGLEKSFSIGTDGKKFIKGDYDFDIKPGKTVYIKLRDKKKNVTFHDPFNWYTLSLDFNKASSKFTTNKD